MVPPAYLSQKFSQSLPTKDGGVLHTVSDASRDLLALPENLQHGDRWVRMADAIMAQKPVATVSNLVNMALFLDGKLDLAAL
jgi:hypothetical protein